MTKGQQKTRERKRPIDIFEQNALQLKFAFARNENKIHHSRKLFYIKASSVNFNFVANNLQKRCQTKESIEEDFGNMSGL